MLYSGFHEQHPSRRIGGSIKFWITLYVSVTDFQGHCWIEHAQSVASGCIYRQDVPNISLFYKNDNFSIL